ncbi:MAG: hypothetical protein H0X51_00310 [Parachlamydiaceae bacterium]|nr:hypothetical protein [Parachlamydiaceae bacterium]
MTRICQPVAYTNHPSTTPLVTFHNHIVKTFSRLPSTGKCFVVLGKVILVAIASFVYLVLGLIAIVGYPYKTKKQFSSQAVEKLHAELSNAQQSLQKRNILLKIASEERRQNKTNEANAALDEVTKILDAEQEKYVEKYCEVAKLRILMNPNVEPAELQKAVQLEKQKRNKYQQKRPLPPAYLSDYIVEIAKCYYLLNNAEMVNEQIRTLNNFASRFEYHNPTAFVGIFERSAKLQIELNRLDDACNIIHSNIVRTLTTPFNNIDMRPSIECCVNLATVLIEHGHSKHSSVARLIELAELKFSPWKDKTGFDVEELRNLIKEVSDKRNAVSARSGL